ncbi:hypothetical protein VTK56DRAFT_5958 [Thermocarpiscus australiensis]
MSRQPISEFLLPDLENAFYEAFKGTLYKYVVMGGVALKLLGSTRDTSEIDLFVPDGQSHKVAKQLGASEPSRFGICKGEGLFYHVWYKAYHLNYKVTIWEPRQINLPFPGPDGVFVTTYKACILKPAVLLNHKCYFWAQHESRGDKAWQDRDASDILFLVKYMRDKKMAAKEEVSHATPEFFETFFEYTSKEKAAPLFRAIGLQLGQ